MSEADFRHIRVLEKRDRGPSGVGLKLDAAAGDLASSFRMPGQYLRVRARGSESVAYLALASAPADGSPWELLLQPGGAAVDEILAGLGPKEAPGEIETGSAEGKGFGLEEQRGRALLLIAGGSGISALRSVLREVLANRDHFGAVTLLHGVRTPEAVAYPEEHSAWREAGVDLRITVSGEATEWEGPRGRVQDLLGELALDPAACSAFLCGPKQMQDDIKALLQKKGFAADRVRTNF